LDGVGACASTIVAVVAASPNVNNNLDFMTSPQRRAS
jgi:hypothetical protein